MKYTLKNIPQVWNIEVAKHLSNMKKELREHPLCEKWSGAKLLRKEILGE